MAEITQAEAIAKITAENEEFRAAFRPLSGYNLIVCQFCGAQAQWTAPGRVLLCNYHLRELFPEMAVRLGKQA